jgi:hypothetical protein
MMSTEFVPSQRSTTTVDHTALSRHATCRAHTGLRVCGSHRTTRWLALLLAWADEIGIVMLVPIYRDEIQGNHFPPRLCVFACLKGHVSTINKCYAASRASLVFLSLVTCASSLLLVTETAASLTPNFSPISFSFIPLSR